MRYIELKHDGVVYTGESKINDILKKQRFFWLMDSEIENAVIEIRKNTLIWHDGQFYSGHWHYGIFKGGDFRGSWENGIFEGGNFEGKYTDESEKGVTSEL